MCGGNRLPLPSLSFLPLATEKEYFYTNFKLAHVVAPTKLASPEIPSQAIRLHSRDGHPTRPVPIYDSQLPVCQFVTHIYIMADGPHVGRMPITFRVLFSVLNGTCRPIAAKDDPSPMPPPNTPVGGGAPSATPPHPTPPPPAGFHTS